MADIKLPDLTLLATADITPATDTIPIIHNGIVEKVTVASLQQDPDVLTDATTTYSGTERFAVKQSGGWRRISLTNLSAWLIQTVATAIQSGASTVARTVQDWLRDRVSVFDYMTAAERADVRAGTMALDHTAAIQAAIVGVSHGHLHFPTGSYRLSAQVGPALYQRLLVTGEGIAQTKFWQHSGTAGGWKFQTNGRDGAGGIQGCTIGAISATEFDPGSMGIGLHMDDCGEKFTVRDVVITNFDTGMKVEASYSENVDNVYIRCFRDYGLLFPDGTPGTQLEGRYSNFQISNIGFTDAGASVGFALKNSGGLFFTDFDIMACNIGVQVKPGAGSLVTYCTFRNVLADTSISDNWVVDGSAGGIYGCKAVACWASYSTGGSGLLTKGTVEDFQWLGGHLRENGHHGWDHQGGTNVALTGVSIARNSKAATNTYDGVHVAAGVSEWSITGGRNGDFGSTGAWGQRYGVFIAAGATDNFLITGHDLRGNLTGALSNGAAGTNFNIQSCLPASVNTVIPVTQGGTGISTLPAYRIPYGNGTNAFQSSSGFIYNGQDFSVNCATGGALFQFANTTTLSAYSDAASQIAIEAYLTGTPSTKYDIFLCKWGGIVKTNALLAAGSMTSTSATGGVGYATGAGGTATQGAGSGKATTVVLDTVTGEITMNNALLAAATIVSFTFTNATIATGDVLVLNHVTTGTRGAYTLESQCAAGSAVIYVRNNTAGSLSEAIVIRFALIKGATA